MKAVFKKWTAETENGQFACRQSCKIRISRNDDWKAYWFIPL